LVLTAAWTGLRFGELAALQRRYVDLLHRTIVVERALSELDGGRLAIKGPKTATGRRTVAVPAQLVPVLEQHLRDYAEAKGVEGYVFVGAHGGLLRRSQWSKIWRARVLRPGSITSASIDLNHWPARSSLAEAPPPVSFKPASGTPHPRPPTGTSTPPSPVTGSLLSASTSSWTVNVSRLAQKTEDRCEAARTYIEAAGGKLHGFWYAFGEHDGYNVWEATDNVSMAAVALAIAGGGALSKSETTVLMTVEETMDAMRSASEIRYRPPRS
jgi:uncharacterized protein with GYD domain